MKDLSKQHCNLLVPEWSVGPIPLLMHLLLFLYSWQTKDLPVQPERPSYPAPLFLSPCVSYGGCGMVLHCPAPRAHPAPRRAQQQQQGSVRSPPSPVCDRDTDFLTACGPQVLSPCHPQQQLNLCFPSVLFSPDPDQIPFGKYFLSVTALRRKTGFLYICVLI